MSEAMTKVPRKCARKGCNRPAKRGWTHCAKHFSAGDSVKNAKRKRSTITAGQRE